MISFRCRRLSLEHLFSAAIGHALARPRPRSDHRPTIPIPLLGFPADRLMLATVEGTWGSVQIRLRVLPAIPDRAKPGPESILVRQHRARSRTHMTTDGASPMTPSTCCLACRNEPCAKSLQSQGTCGYPARAGSHAILATPKGSFPARLPPKTTAARPTSSPLPWRPPRTARAEYCLRNSGTILNAMRSSSHTQ